ncbi:MAG: transposase family protein [Anaerolineae bacterium]
MILRYQYLSQNEHVFKAMTGLRLVEFDELVQDVLPGYAEAEEKRLSGPDRKRAIGGGPDFELAARDQILLTVVWLRKYPTYEVLGYLFGTSDTTVGRYISRVLPLLEAAGRDTMRLPNPGRKRRRQLDDLLKETPELAVIIDTFEQAVQRPQKRAEADPYYSGKKKRHTLKSQVAVDEDSGQIVDVAASTHGPTADLTVLKQSGLLDRLPPGVGAIADLAYVGLASLHPSGLGATPRRKPRGQPRPAEDIAFNTAFSRRRIKVEHTIGRVRRYEALNQTDRHHRTRHTARVVAVAGLVNRQIRHRLPGLVC